MTMLRDRQWLILLAVLILALSTAGTALAQEVDEDGAPVGPEIEGDPAMYPDPPPDDDGTVEAAEADFILAQPPYTMNYQGYLTDSSGTPLNGTHEFVVSLWDAATGGNPEWGPETHEDVAVSKGLFNLVLGSIVDLLPDDFDEALYLNVVVDGTELPRQPLHATAYAFGLVPGAEVQGAPSDSIYALVVHNTGTGATQRGLYVSGEQYGIFVRETGTGDVALRAQDFIQAQGYRSTADSWYFTAGMEGDFWTNEANVRKGNDFPGRAELKSTSGSQSAYFYLPLHVPAVQYGQKVTVENVVVHYFTSNSNTYIDHTSLRKQVNHGWTTETLYNNATNRTSTSPTSYSFTPTGGNQLDSSEGILILRLTVRLADPSHTLYIGGVSVRLGHMN